MKSSHFTQLLVVFLAIVLNYNMVSTRRGHRGGGHSRVGHNRQSHHRPSSYSSSSHSSISHRRNFPSSRSDHSFHHNAAPNRISGIGRSRYPKHPFGNRLNSRKPLLSNLRHSSKSFHRVNNNQILDSSVHIHNRNRNKHISSKSLSISPTINSVSYNNPIVGGVGGIGVGGIGVGEFGVGGIGGIVPYSVNAIPTVAVGLPPTIVNIQPGFDNTPPFINDPFPPVVNNPPPYPVGSPYLNTPPNLYRPRCYEELRQITDEGQEVIILTFYYLDELYLHNLNNYPRSSNKEFEGTYPCYYYEPNIR